jgi:hypothetical protein
MSEYESSIEVNGKLYACSDTVAAEVGRLTAENAELRERLKGMCTIEVDPKCELAKESKEGM